MQVSPDERYMLFTLYDGCSYNENIDRGRTESPLFTRVFFKKNLLSIDLSSFAFNKSDESIFQGGYQMMNLRQLDSNVVRLKKSNKEESIRQRSNFLLTSKDKNKGTMIDMSLITRTMDHNQLSHLYRDAIVRSARTAMQNYMQKAMRPKLFTSIDIILNGTANLHLAWLVLCFSLSGLLLAL